MGNLDFSANADQLKELAAYMASQINVPTIGIGGGYAPIGTIISIMGTTAPQDYLSCDGTVYNIADYPQLADYFESQFGESNHFGGDGATTFAVPDLQGEFLRGTGTNSHANQGSGANVGVHQDGTIFPYIKSNNSSGSVTVGLSPLNDQFDDISTKYNYDSISSILHAHGYMTMSSTSANEHDLRTSRPTNTSVLYCIKAVVAGEVYSTEERVVGTWIDGKKIYQRLFDMGNTQFPINTAVEALKNNEIFNIIDKAIYVDLIYHFDDGYPAGGRFSSLDNSLVATQMERKYIAVKNGNFGTNHFVQSWIIIQYTKTTNG